MDAVVQVDGIVDTQPEHILPDRINTVVEHVYFTDHQQEYNNAAAIDYSVNKTHRPLKKIKLSNGGYYLL